MSSRKKDQDRKEKHKIAKCHNCGKIGHIKFDCPNFKSKSGTSIQNKQELDEFCSLHRTYYIVFANGRDILSRKLKFSDHVWSKEIPVKLTSYLSFYTICARLKDEGLLDYDMVAEDKRSGPNLLQVLSIEGKKVNHTRQKMLGDDRKCSFFPRICELYDIRFFAPLYCEKALITFLLCKPFSKDLRLIIARKLWNSRYDNIAWVAKENMTKENFGKKFKINVLCA